MSKFHFRLRELRNSRKLSQQELANYLHISKSSINMYERGEREPGLDTLEAIADFFNVDMDYLSGKTLEIKSFTTESVTDDKQPLTLPNGIVLTSDEKKLIDMYRGFNDEGKEKALERLSEMAQLEQYKKCAKSDVVEKEA